MSWCCSNGRPVIETWENTYQMKPNDNERFVQAAVEALIKKAMTIKLENMTWDEEACRVAAMELCGDIKEQVKGELAGRIPPFA